MNKKYLAILMILCLLPYTALADIAPGECADSVFEFKKIAYEYTADGDVQLTQRYFDRASNIYRPIKYITIAYDGTVLNTETKVEHVATITYRLYYTINGENEYVSGGVSTSNGYPAVAAVNYDKFAAVATPGTNPVWSVSAYPDLSGISYTIKGGVFTLTCNHTVYIDQNGNFVAGVPTPVRLMYSYSTTYP